MIEREREREREIEMCQPTPIYILRPRPARGLPARSGRRARKGLSPGQSGKGGYHIHRGRQGVPEGVPEKPPEVTNIIGSSMPYEAI